MKHVLILGAGLVSRPIVRYLLEHGKARLTVASLAFEDAEALVENHPRGLARQVDVSDSAQLEPLIQESDLVVSLVPYAFHVQVARCAIRHRVNMITASYVSPEMRALEPEAKAKGVTILNELGLDPGLDHMSAMRMIDAVQDAGGKIRRFVSACGGLPSPEAANNPWKYKFSWSPRGALLAGKLSARYLDDGRVVNIPGESLFGHTWPYEVEDLGRFEIYPNRDSLHYIDAYGLSGIETMIRATIRYVGWSETMQVISGLGMLDVDRKTRASDLTFAQFTESFLPNGTGSVRERLAAHTGVSVDHPIVERLAWAGLFSSDRLPEPHASALGILARKFQERMAYGPDERDMVVLRHEIIAEFPDRPAERRLSLLVAYGEPGGDSATSRTVSLPAAVAGQLVLEDELELPGIHIPTDREVYGPILDRLESLGIAFREWDEPAD